MCWRSGWASIRVTGTVPRQCVRKLAGYLSGDLGVAVSGLTRSAFEKAKVEEARWQEVGAGNQAEAGPLLP